MAAMTEDTTFSLPSAIAITTKATSSDSSSSIPAHPPPASLPPPDPASSIRVDSQTTTTTSPPPPAPLPPLASSTRVDSQTTSPPPSPRTTSRPRVYVTRRIPQRGVDILLRHCDVNQWDSEQAVPHGELLHSVVGAMAIFCMPCDVIDAQVLAAAGPGLQVVTTISPTTDHIDMAYCQARNIKVIPCPHQSAINFAELTVALVLLTVRDSMTEVERLSIIDEPLFDECSKSNAVKNGNKCFHHSTWRPQLLRRQSEEQLAYQWSNGKPANTNCLAWKNIAQKTFGIYGLTQTGTSVAHLLETLGVNHVLVSGPKSLQLNSSHMNGMSDHATNYSVVPFTQLLLEADIICVCGSNEEKIETVFGRDAFKQMKKSAILVTSQSDEQAIDYIALYEALRDGQIKAAGLNDCNQVSVPFKTPLLGLKNCIFLPQTQESVYDMRHKVSVLMADNLIKALKVSNQS